jgi:hypothetical protein
MTSRFQASINAVLKIALIPINTLTTRAPAEERRGIAFLEGADVVLADIGIDFHFFQVGRDQKQGRRLKARSHGLAHRDATQRCPRPGEDVRVVEIDLGGINLGRALLDGGLVENDLRLILFVCAAGILDRILRYCMRLRQALVGFQGDFRVSETKL